MKEDKMHTDDFLKDAFKHLGTEKPSINFTDNLMSKIEALESKPLSVYKPVLSTPVKFLIGIAFASMLIFFMINSDGQSSLIPLDYVKLPSFSLDFSLPSFNLNYNFSNIVIYSALIFGIVFSIQLYFIKNKLNSISY